jgi:isopentenyl diphosphate isomerase/L-lactate dehydrogenase-like FMN-dependent dehydrogenase
VLRALRQEFELTMRLSGLSRLSELGPDCLQYGPGQPQPGQYRTAFARP